MAGYLYRRVIGPAGRRSLIVSAAFLQRINQREVYHSAMSGEYSKRELENMVLSEDKRLVRLGLDPDSNPIERMLAVHRLAEHYRAEELREREARISVG